MKHLLLLLPSLTQNMLTLSVCFLSLTNQFLFNSPSMYYAFAGYWISHFLPFFCLFFLKLCTSLRNLPPLPLADNPLRKMPLIATLPLVPFQFTLLPLSLFSNQTFPFHFLNRRAAPPNYNTASLTQDLFAFFLSRGFICYHDVTAAWREPTLPF